MIGVGQLMVQTRNVLLTCQPFFFIYKQKSGSACLSVYWDMHKLVVCKHELARTCPIVSSLTKCLTRQTFSTLASPLHSR